MIAATSTGLHLWAHFNNYSSPHHAALGLVTVGFGGLTILSIVLDLWRSPVPDATLPRFAAAMCVLLFSIAFVYFDSRAGHFHHAGIPLSLFLASHRLPFFAAGCISQICNQKYCGLRVVLLGFVLESKFPFY